MNPKTYDPPRRLVELGMVLKFDKHHTPIFKEHERFAINQERARAIRGDNSYCQSDIVEGKIARVISIIYEQDWKPFYEIQYARYVPYT